MRICIFGIVMGALATQMAIFVLLLFGGTGANDKNGLVRYRQAVFTALLKSVV